MLHLRTLRATDELRADASLGVAPAWIRSPSVREKLEKEKGKIISAVSGVKSPIPCPGDDGGTASYHRRPKRFLLETAQRGELLVASGVERIS
jgi:hypothetical protein